MRFVKNGPDIPERLLQAHEDGRVVFFCGAGISFPAGLRGFDWLVNRLYTELGATPSPVAQAAIRRKQFDTAIGLLEQDYPGRRDAVRPQLVSILSPDLSKPQAIATHEALLNLARSREGHYRLITTNFDRLFEEVITQYSLPLQTFRAPLLPVPKNHCWDGLVYLHGLLPLAPTSSDLSRLVISSGDFGLAYLTERWAARFVSELFRNYTVCFVGYSINDPVLRYMMDALAAGRLLGEATPETFAFGSHAKGREEESANEWGAKNVTPILYREHSNHAYLHRTLRTWADTYRDGVLGKERIVMQYAMTQPSASTKQDDFVGRLLWALSDQRVLPAKCFADFDPLPPFDWLEPLTATHFFHRDLVSSVHSGVNQLDKVMFELARWLARHIDNPKLILWVAQKGGMPHTQFAWLIAKELEAHPPSQPMQTLWQLVLSGRLHSRAPRSDLYDWRKRLKLGGLSPTLRLQLRDLLSPQVSLREPFRWWKDEDKDEVHEPTQLKNLVDWEIVLGIDHAHSALQDMSKDMRWPEILPDLLSDATTLLHDALDLMRELGGADSQHDTSYMHQPSISEHPQNRDFHDWTALICLSRDAWLETAARFPKRARQEAERWLDIRYPLFRRLAFFAATDSTLFSPQEAFGWLIADDNWWLWSVETEREALRLLVTIAPQLGEQSSGMLQRAILQGPPRVMFRDDIEPQRLQQTFDREIWLRLAKCNAAGASLGVDAVSKLQALSQQFPAWQLAEDESDEFPYWTGDGEDLRIFLTTPKRRRELVIWLRDHQSIDRWQEDDWRERCKRNFSTTACALLYLAQQGEWFPERWREALQAWADEALASRSWRYMGGVLATISDTDAKKIAPALSGWLQSIAKTFRGNEDDFFLLIRKVLEIHRDEAVKPDDDPVFRAINHPVGRVTEAALHWWYRQSLEDGQGLTDVLKPLFTNLCDTNVKSFRHGRVMLATHVVALFRVDRQWTMQYILPLFDWQHSVLEARAAWDGFLRSPRPYRPLMETIKPQFLATAQQYVNLGEYGNQYAALLTFAALEQDETYSTTELAAATRSLPTHGLQMAAQALVSALEGAGEQRAEYLRNRILPYLKFIWPQSRNAITPAISAGLAKLCITAQEGFPDALQALKHWLQPLDHPDFVVHLLHKAKLCERFPEDALWFLDAVIGDNAQWPPGDLKTCLDDIRNVQPELEPDIRFQRLHNYLRQHGVA